MPGDGLAHGPTAKQKAGGSRHKVQPNHSAFPCVMVFDAYIVLSS
jgi:hypothetical protein